MVIEKGKERAIEDSFTDDFEEDEMPEIDNVGDHDNEDKRRPHADSGKEEKGNDTNKDKDEDDEDKDEDEMEVVVKKKNMVDDYANWDNGVPLTPEE